ncbi:MAG TPA: tripartite tricarboxylate transporter substrate binding protein [Burkholderiales bacterium]|jgi:tripartite-type tricarboxylate transporter receptor subunit TctC|nr:tripartite tricarboxylate transporter substrate binding protein [Burkholderiales bacterium]
MMPRKTMKLIFGATVTGAISLLSAPPAVFAQAYPAKSVRIVVSWPPGGSNDVVARVVAQRLTESLGQQFIVENRAGATGTIGSDLVAKSPPDGYTILVNSATHVANPHVYKKLPYDTMKDFTGVMPLATQVGMLVVHPSLPVKSVKELIAFAKARPGQVAYASTGTGSYTHLTMALFLQMTGTKMLEVNYKGGGPAVIGLAAGETQVFFVGIGSVDAAVRAGRLRALGVASAQRLKAFPDLPTVAEAGVPGYEMTAWIGSFVPSATPRAIVERLNAEITKAVQHPDVVKILGAQALDPMIMTVDEFAQRLKKDYDRYEKVIKATGARVDNG